jgi:PncC family amidohydrolase
MGGLEEKVGRLLAERDLTIAVAESCTGGLICHRITNVPGSSRYFIGGVVAYSNETKMKILGVGEDTIKEHGAVSREVALEMARGIRELLGADLGLSATGIAGPGGGTPEKPVGLVYISLVSDGEKRCERHIWHGSRLENKIQTSEAALEMLLGYLEANKR